MTSLPQLPGHQCDRWGSGQPRRTPGRIQGSDPSANFCPRRVQAHILQLCPSRHSAQITSAGWGPDNAGAQAIFTASGRRAPHVPHVPRGRRERPGGRRPPSGRQTRKGCQLPRKPSLPPPPHKTIQWGPRPGGELSCWVSHPARRLGFAQDGPAGRLPALHWRNRGAGGAHDREASEVPRALGCRQSPSSTLSTSVPTISEIGGAKEVIGSGV